MRGLHRIVIELIHGVSDYFRTPRLVYAGGRDKYSYVIPALQHLLSDSNAWRWDEIVDAVMELLFHFFQYLPDSTYLMPGAPRVHPAEQFCTSEDSVSTLTRYAEALARRHSKRSPQKAGHCFRLIAMKVAADGLPPLPIDSKIIDSFRGACSNIPDGVWAQSDGAADDDDLSVMVLHGSG